MLPQKNRLKRKKEFESVFQEGLVFFEDFFILKIKKNNFSFPRFAFVFPIKSEKRATERNRVKRLFREVIKSFLPNIRENKDIIFIFKKEAKKKKYKEIKEEIEKVFKKRKII